MHAASFWQRNRHWSIFGIMSVASLLSYFHQVGLATVSGDVARSLDTDAAALGLMSAAFSYPYAAMQIPAGLLSDSLGPRKSVTLFLLLAAAGTALFAAAQGLAGALVARVLIGVGISMIAVPLMKLTAVWFPPKDFGKVTALSFTLGGTGYWLATSPMAYAASGFGWRMPFLALAWITVACAILVWCIVRDAPEQVHTYVDTSFCEKKTCTLRHVLRSIVTCRHAWILGFWYFFQGGIYFSFVGLWGGQYMMQVLGMAPTESGWILSLAACALMTAPLFTWLADRIHSRRKLFVILPLLSAVLTIPLVCGVEELSPSALCILFLAFSMTAIGGAAVLFSAAVDQFPVAYSGTVTGFINMFPFAGGAVLQQGMGWAINFLTERGIPVSEAFTTAFSVYCAAGVASALLGLMHRERKKYPHTE